MFRITWPNLIQLTINSLFWLHDFETGMHSTSMTFLRKCRIFQKLEKVNDIQNNVQKQNLYTARALVILQNIKNIKTSEETMDLFDHL